MYGLPRLLNIKYVIYTFIFWLSTFSPTNPVSNPLFLDDCTSHVETPESGNEKFYVWSPIDFNKKYKSTTSWLRLAMICTWKKQIQTPNSSVMLCSSQNAKPRSVGRSWQKRKLPAASRFFFNSKFHMHIIHIPLYACEIFTDWKSEVKGPLWTNPRRYPVLSPCAHVFNMSALMICFVFLFSAGLKFRFASMFSLECFVNVSCAYVLQVVKFLVAYLEGPSWRIKA